MGKSELSGRDTWQDYCGEHAGKAEKSFFEAFTKAFEGTDFQIREKPKEMRNIYRTVQLSDSVLQQIYNPQNQDYTHGIVPDYAIDHVGLDRHLYVEVKRQDGWVETKPKAAGRGNAHERSCKLFTPGLLKVMRSYGHLGDDVLPFWVVFQGDITRDPNRNREIHCWYTGVENHFFMWRNTLDPTQLMFHFNTYLKPLLLGQRTRTEPLMGVQPDASLNSVGSVRSSPQVSQPEMDLRAKSSMRS